MYESRYILIIILSLSHFNLFFLPNPTLSRLTLWHADDIDGGVTNDWTAMWNRTSGHVRCFTEAERIIMDPETTLSPSGDPFNL